MSLLNDAKRALRISHNELDVEIYNEIEAARQDMIRCGVAESQVNEDEPASIISLAIITFVKSHMANSDNERKSYMESYDYQVDNLRKSHAYNTEVNNV